MFNNRHANLWRLRLLLIPFTLVVGALFAAARSLDVQEFNGAGSWEPRSIVATVISFISFVTYIYAVWGATRIPNKVRTFLVFGLTYGLIFCCFGPLFEFGYGSSTNGGQTITTTLGCFPGETPCQVLKTAQVLGVITGFIMLLEVIATLRLGPLDHNLRKHQYQSGGGYQAGANVMIVRPDYVHIQPPMVQVPVQPHFSMQQPYPYQPQPQFSYPQHEVIQHHPLPQLPQTTQSSATS